MLKLEHLASTLIAQLRSRMELLSVEWQEEKLRIRNLVLSLLLLLFFVQLAIMSTLLALLVAYWETPARIPIVTFSAVLFAGAAWLSWRSLRHGVTDQSNAFQETTRQLRQDEHALTPSTPVQSP